jgi:hypothetical protein
MGGYRRGASASVFYVLVAGSCSLRRVSSGVGELC